MVKDFPADCPMDGHMDCHKDTWKISIYYNRKKDLPKYLRNYWYKLVSNWGEIWYNSSFPRTNDVTVLGLSHGLSAGQKDFSQNIAFQICVCYNGNRKRASAGNRHPLGTTDRRLARIISRNKAAQFSRPGRLFLCLITIFAHRVSNSKAGQAETQHCNQS